MQHGTDSTLVLIDSPGTRLSLDPIDVDNHTDSIAFDITLRWGESNRYSWLAQRNEEWISTEDLRKFEKQLSSLVAGRCHSAELLDSGKRPILVVESINEDILVHFRITDFVGGAEFSTSFRIDRDHVLKMKTRLAEYPKWW